jgi:hypothetical protein
MSTGFVDVSGLMIDISGSWVPPPDILTLSDILGERALVVAKEEADGASIRLIGTTPVLTFKPVCIEWVSKGCPDNYPLLTVEINPPPLCSDGVVRSLPEYIDYCSGTTLPTVIGQLQAKLPDIRVSFANVGGSVAVLLSRV